MVPEHYYMSPLKKKILYEVGGPIYLFHKSYPEGLLRRGLHQKRTKFQDRHSDGGGRNRLWDDLQRLGTLALIER